MQIEKRSMAGSDVWMTRIAQAVWSLWDIKKSVKEGYQANSWVYLAVSIRASAVASVPWIVYGKDNEMLWDHPVSKLLRKPNPHWSRQQMFELITDWLSLAGSAYLKRVIVGGRTAELWPVSPDRIAPVPSTDPAKFIDGYKVKIGGVERISADYTPQNMIHLRFIDPSNPYAGISPLGAAARAVDLDNAQQDWNVSTMQNRGVPDGIFTFKQQLDQTQAASITERIKAKWFGIKNARKPLVLGSDAAYQRLTLTPVEMDFLASRKMNREEIFAVFGVPPQLGGSQEASTYDNFAAANRVFWETTVIGILEKIQDGLQLALADELSDDETIGPDLSNISALAENEGERAITAERYVKMGVPFEQVNDKLELGFEAWDGWDKPRAVTPAGSLKIDEEPKAEDRAWKVKPFERRSIADEMAARDRYAEGPFKAALAAVLDAQRTAVFAAMESGADVKEASKLHRDEWRAALTKGYLDVAGMSGVAVLDQTRGRSPWLADEMRARGAWGVGVLRLQTREAYSPEMMQAIELMLESEGIVLRELALIDATTTQTILDQIAYGLENELTIADMQQALLDTGVFSAERAARIARTEAGTAMSVGQMAAGQLAGAESKTWVTSGFETRDIHTARDGETVDIGARFSVQSGSVGPRFPGDPEIAADDRVNCRCGLTFS